MTLGTDPFRIRDFVPDFEAIREWYDLASARTRASLDCRLDVPYGTGPDEKIDLFFPPGGGAGRPVHLFVHGGYWRAHTKSNYSYIADTITRAGAIAAMVDYTLIPRARLATLVDQVRRAALWLAANAEAFGGDGRALSASGHSAGAHLASLLAVDGALEPAGRPVVVSSLLLLSGLFDLQPITRSFLQAELSLTAEEVEAWSPIGGRLPPDIRFDVVVGANETAPFLEQSDAFVGRLAAIGNVPHYSVLPDEDHMTIVRTVGQLGTGLAARLAETIEASR